MRNRTLLLIAVVAVVAWVLLRGRMSTASLPWNRGQAGSVFQEGLMGGGQ